MSPKIHTAVDPKNPSIAWVVTEYMSKITGNAVYTIEQETNGVKIPYTVQFNADRAAAIKIANRKAGVR